MTQRYDRGKFILFIWDVAGCGVNALASTTASVSLCGLFSFHLLCEMKRDFTNVAAFSLPARQINGKDVCWQFVTQAKHMLANKRQTKDLHVGQTETKSHMPG